MKFEFWVIGKTKEKYFNAAEQEYLKRLKRYTKLKYQIIPEIKKFGGDPEVLKLLEADLILGQCEPTDYMILLDEKGTQYTSVQFSEKMNKLQISTYKRVLFIIGGAFGFHETVYERAQEKVSLSEMTFSHQMIRTFFLEQMYRAFTILRGENYHNEKK
ncbi:23S rRNA (pseudouridine(1915)-N(3))-methyltransferase RlmH [Portibacter marinus]|uniref:23S rRNA (pseudouridine(1915)-N(3))-methyltransferase RlmH n=1 Tax=Portibacter marinus TaxID=2898660 RepID=UPI001F2947B5|nr:23S rRNA (pseudouridine(1915)-N(3))-methyltransferase RlmH [Portibacter marinus]